MNLFEAVGNWRAMDGARQSFGHDLPPETVAYSDQS